MSYSRFLSTVLFIFILSSLLCPAAPEGAFFGVSPAITVKENSSGNTLLVRSGTGDAFALWGAAPNKAAVVPIQNDRVRVKFGAFSGKAGVQISLKFHNAEGKGKGSIVTWIEKQEGPGTVELPSAREIAKSHNIQTSDSVMLHFRLVGGGPNGSVEVEEVGVGDKIQVAGTSKIARRGNSAGGTGSLTLDQEPNELPDLKVATKMDSALQIVRYGIDSKATFELRNEGTFAMKGTMDAVIEDFYGVKTPLKNSPFQLEAGKSIEWPLPVDQLGRGFYFIRSKIEVEGKKREDILRFGIMVPNGIPKELPKVMLYGLCNRNVGKKDTAEYMVFKNMLEYVGIKSVRSDWDWQEIQPTPDQWNWEKINYNVNALQELGVEPLAIFAYSPPWAVPAEFRNKDREVWRSHPPDLAAFSRYITEAVKQHPTVKYWEVWNEPDLTQFYNGTVKEYQAMLTTAHKAVKSVSPDAFVMTGGFATAMTHGLKRFPDMQERVARENADDFEIMAHHEHAKFTDFMAALERLKSARSITGKKPWFFNETAFNPKGNGLQSEREQAIGYVKKHLALRAWGGKAHYWYSYRHKKGWGMLEGENQPKPVALTMATLIRELGQKPFLNQIDLGHGNFGYLFGDADKSVAVVWSETNDAARSVVTVPLPKNAKVMKVNLTGSEQELPIVEGRVGMAVDTSPSYYRFEGLDRPKPERPLISIPGSLIGYRGGTVDMDVELFNPTDTPKIFKLQQIGSSSAPSNMSLSPGDSKKVTFKLPVSRDSNLRFGDHVNLQLGYEVEGTKWKGELTIPMQIGALIPKMMDGRAPDFVVENRGNIQNLFDYVPGHDDKLWKGAADLSLQSSLAIEQDSLVIKTIVSDDVQHQAEEAQTMWAGDSLVIGLQKENAEVIHLGVALGNDGILKRHVWEGSDALKSAFSTSPLEIVRKDNKTTYILRLPLTALGLVKADLQTGIRFNLLANDNDTFGREGWVFLAPGLAPSINSKLWPVVKFE